MIKETLKKKSILCLILLEIIGLFSLLSFVCLNAGSDSDSLDHVMTLGKEYFPDALCEIEETDDAVYREELSQKVFLDLKGSQEVAQSKDFYLEKGDYVFSIDYACHEDTNGIVVCERYGEEREIIASSIPESKSDQSETFFSVSDSSNPVFVAMLCKDENGFSIYRADLYRVTFGAPVAARVISVFLLWLLLCIIADAFIIAFVNHPEYRKTYILLLGSVVLLSIPMMIPPFYFRRADDLYFHVMRIFGLRDGILHGSLFTKLQMNWYHGYGYPVSACYGDLFLYPSALASIAGVPIEFCYRLLVVLINCLTVFSSYYCFRKVFGRRGGLAGCIVYVFLFYRAIDIFRRAAVGEYLAIAFLPFLVCAVYYLFRDEHRRSMIHFVIGFTGLINSHILTTEMVVFALVLFMIINWRKALDPRRLLSLAVSAVTVLLVNLAFIVPFLDTAFGNELMVLKSDEFALLPSESGIRFENIIGNGENTMFAYAAMPIIFLLLIVPVVHYMRRKAQPEETAVKKYAGLILFPVLAAVFLFMSTAYFPWDILMDVPVLGTVVSSIQFPWRWLAFANLFAALAVCVVFRDAPSEKAPSLLRYADKAVMISFIVIGTLFGCLQYSTFERVDCKMPESIDWVRSSNHEYLIAGTDIYDMDRRYSTSGNVTISDFEKDSNGITFSFESSADSSIDLPVFNYNHYQAVLKDEDGKTLKDLSVETGTNNRVRVLLPEKTEGRVKVSFHTPVYWVLSYIVSAVSVFGICVMSWRKRRNGSADPS